MNNYFHQAELILAQPDTSGNLILLSLHNGNYYALDEVGSRVWQLCDGTHSVAQIVAILAQEYSAAAETIQQDVVELLRDLANKKLVLEGLEMRLSSNLLTEIL